MLKGRILVLIASVLSGAFLCGGLRAALHPDAGVTVPSSPGPYNGAANVKPGDLTLSWSPVAGAQSYSVYFGPDPDGLALLKSEAKPPLQLGQDLVPGKCYWWRVDTGAAGPVTVTGPLWRFTVAAPPAHDPDLLAWYGFDEAAGTASGDWSGHGLNAELDRMTWDTTGAPGLDGGCVCSDGTGGVFLDIPATAQPLGRTTLTGWFRIPPQDEPAALWCIGAGANSYVSLVRQPPNGCLCVEVKGAGQSQPVTTQVKDALPIDHWTHLAVTMDGAAGQITVYEDGVVVLTASGLTRLKDVLASAGSLPLGASFTLDASLRCSMDEVRLYRRLLDAEEIARSMLGHPDSPYEPEPRHWAQVHTSTPAVLRWEATSAALAYNVYAGADVNHLDLVGQNLTKPECPLKQALADGQTLCWRVEAAVEGGVVAGPLWQFCAAGLSLADVIKGATPWWADYAAYYHQVAPDFSLTDMDGRGHRVRDYRGRHLMLVVWSPLCSVCRGELATLSKLRKETSEEELMLLSVTDEAYRSAMSAFLADHPEVNFPVCVTKLSVLPPFSSVTHYPSMFYVDPDGTMKLGTVGAVPLDIIESILQAAWPYES